MLLRRDEPGTYDAGEVCTAADVPPRRMRGIGGVSVTDRTQDARMVVDGGVSHLADRNAEQLLASWRQLQADLPSLSARLHADKLDAIRPDVALPRDVNVADED